MLCLGGYSGLVPDSGSTATLVLIKTLIVTHRPLPTVSETLEPALPRDRSIKGLGDANWGDPPHLWTLLSPAEPVSQTTSS